MQNPLLDHVAQLPSTEVIAGLEREVRAERGATARVIAWLVEVERRKLYLDAGFNSLFTYCVEVLGFSEDETCNRTGAVRAVLEYPAVLEMLEDRSITMTTARLLYPHLKGQPDPAAVLKSVAGQSRRAVERLIATLAPRPDVATSIRKVPVAPTPHALAFGTQGTVAATTARPSPPAQVPSVTGPLSTAGHDQRQRGREARAGSGHVEPRRAQRRRSRRPGAGARPPAGGPGAPSLRVDQRAPAGAGERRRLPARPGRGQARGVGPRPWTVRFRRHVRPPMR
jgi:hypothetical protein